MATNFPTSVDALTNPVSNDSLNSPSHSAQHTNANDAIEAIENYLLTGAGNAGLVLLKTQTIGSGVSSVVVTGAFNATYDVYKIIISGGTANTPGYLSLTLGSATAYIYSMSQITYSTAAQVITAATAATSWPYAGGYTSTNTAANIELISPFLTKPTVVNYATSYATLSSHNVIGIQNSATSFTDFTLTTTGGILTGGTIRVYGYRN